MIFLTVTTYESKLKRKQNWKAWEAAQSDWEVDWEFYLDKKVCDKRSTDT